MTGRRRARRLTRLCVSPSGVTRSPISKLGDWTHGMCPGPPCSQQPLSLSAPVPISEPPRPALGSPCAALPSACLRAPSPCSRQPLSCSAPVPISEPPRCTAPLLPAPTALSLRLLQGLGATARPPGSCFVSAFLWWTLFRPRCRAVRGSVPVLKFLKSPCGASCTCLFVCRGGGSSPRGPCGALQAGLGSPLSALRPLWGRGRGCLCCVSPGRLPSWPAPLLPQMSKVWNDLQPKLRCLFVGPHGAPAPPRPPQDGLSAH